ncbi:MULTISPECIES: DUF3606 domain-containing protein [unclassified Roseateles]|uniref:DUF3606 domain-containing protein n=1 Tax=unclassified Roseateles TaxID=2626991 RepID=UPI0006FA419A|nr:MULTISPECIES: DUF3606 domain-containing protein [unclassified Roseateles]KQW51977.1 hypothetical protein ASC81_05075 [Pelomonas sp. Root405]KRA78210.1 hypothetical protein ASD88_05080 [Pelomonas sp. Root662]
MPDDTPQHSGQARDQIDVQLDDDLHYWAKKFDVTPDQIKEAVDAVGSRASEVEMHLKGSRASTNADQEARGAAAS